MLEQLDQRKIYQAIQLGTRDAITDLSAKRIDIVFDAPPGPEAGRFVEVEDENGASIRVGEWVKRDDGYWVLRLTVAASALHS